MENPAVAPDRVHVSKYYKILVHGVHGLNGNYADRNSWSAWIPCFSAFQFHA